MSEQPSKRLLVDMSATIIHHGHIRLLKRARAAADERDAALIVGLTSDEEVLQAKGYKPELSFAQRKEILLACRYVDEVVAVPWLLTDETLDELSADYLFHGGDNSNLIAPEKLIVVERTEGISSTELRLLSAGVINSQINRQKVMLTPGPGSIAMENTFAVQPLFGRGDEGFAGIEERVHYQLRRLTGLPCICHLQGSASLALEVAARSFIAGRVLIVNTGYYCERLIQYCQTLQQMQRVQQVDVIPVEDFLRLPLPELLAELGQRFDQESRQQYDWVLSVYSETSTALLNDIDKLADLKKQLQAKLFLDATASIGLEEKHHLADLVAFSSCKGLAAMTGAAFICYQDDLTYQDEASFYLNIDTHLGKKMTGPYHPLAALDRLLPRQDETRARVRRSKEAFMAKFAEQVILPPERQPLIGTRIRGELEASDVLPKNVNAMDFAPQVIFYKPRTVQPGESVVCHFGELHLPSEQASQIPQYIELKV